MHKTHQINVSYALFALLLVFSFHACWAEYSKIEPLPYSEFEQSVRDRRIADVQIRDQYVEARLKQPLAGGRERFIITRVEPSFAEHLARYGVKFSGVVESKYLFAHSIACSNRVRGRRMCE